jgi:hypothetical protein
MASTAEQQALALLKSEVARLNTLIAMMESPGKRGRNAMPIANSVKPRRGQRKWSASQRKAASERTKARWAVRKKLAKKKATKKAGQ